MPNQDQDILALIERIRDKDRQACRDLYNKYVRFYMLTCLRYVKTRQDAEDLVQDSFVKIFKDLHQFNPELGSFINWSKRIVIHTCLRHLKRNSIVSFFDTLSDANHSVSSGALENLSLQELTATIQALPRGYRTVFNLFVIDGYKHDEIAEQLNISVGTSKSQLAKAKKMLRVNIEELDLNYLRAYA